MQDRVATLPRIVSSILFHLTPGAIAALTYLYLWEPLGRTFTLPRQLAFVLMDVLVLLPLLLVFLFSLGWRKNRRLSLDGVVLNRRRLPVPRLVLLVGGLFAWAVLVVALLSRVDSFLLARYFHWVPAAFLPEKDLARYSPAILIGAQVASIAIVGVATPVVEELYFRGYLLPRLRWMGRWAPVWHTVLFAGYHFWSPWRCVTRVVFSLPVTWTVWRTRSISVGMWWHCLGNVLGEILTFAAVIRAITSLGRTP